MSKRVIYDSEASRAESESTDSFIVSEGDLLAYKQTKAEKLNDPPASLLYPVSHILCTIPSSL